MVNSRAGYYFSIPDGWVLDSDSDYEDVKVVHPESGTDFTITYDRARGTPTMYYFALLFSLESPDNRWLTFGKGSVKLGGRDAWAFVGTREKEGRKVKQFIWSALVDGYAYLLSSEVDLVGIDQRAPEIDRIFSTFSWGNPPRAS